MPFTVIPDLGKVSENNVHPSRKQRCHVLHDNPSRFNVANNSVHFVPKTGPLSGKTGPRSGNADVLAGEAATDEVNVFKVGSAAFFDVSFTMYLRPMFF